MSLPPQSTASVVTVQPGKWVCKSVQGGGDAQIRLKRLGICEGRTIEVLRCGDPLLLHTLGSQIAVSRRLATCVMVSPAPLESMG